MSLDIPESSSEGNSDDPLRRMFRNALGTVKDAYYSIIGKSDAPDEQSEETEENKYSKYSQLIEAGKFNEVPNEDKEFYLQMALDFDPLNIKFVSEEIQMKYHESCWVIARDYPAVLKYICHRVKVKYPQICAIAIARNEQKEDLRQYVPDLPDKKAFEEKVTHYRNKHDSVKRRNS
ncbi:MAG: hypothetical protein N4A38_00400 [Candidatus Gracilibacteria bacterium]|nr:hypothetical protein [Candidatus Gracilibacteria bacterium]